MHGPFALAGGFAAVMVLLALTLCPARRDRRSPGLPKDQDWAVSEEVHVGFGQFDNERGASQEDRAQGGISRRPDASTSFAFENEQAL